MCSAVWACCSVATTLVLHACYMFDSLKVLDFKFSPCLESRVLHSGGFPSVYSLNADVSDRCVCSIFMGEWVWSVTAVGSVGYCTWKGLARKIAWAPRKEVGGVGAGTHINYLLLIGSGYFLSQTFSRTKPHTSYPLTYEDGTNSVPKRRHLNCRLRGITQKKAHVTSSCLPH
jgi:hypothetical protein